MGNPEQTTAHANCNLVNQHGIHVRTASEIASLCEQYRAEIIITTEHGCSDGRDMMRLLMLQAKQGTVLELDAKGSDAETAISALVALIEAGFPMCEP